jgi:protein tyrosine/serine phosphatase
VTQALEWEGCLNVRDLGGLPTEDGRVTQPGRVVRADNIRKLTDAGWQALADHGVNRIVDLRMPTELAGDPPREVAVDVVHVSIFGDDVDEAYVAELDAHLESVDDVADHYAYSYVDWLERYRDQFGRAFAAIADADGAVLVHCMGGKDRTGIVSALLLRLAHVPYDAIGDDYAVTAANLEPSTSVWIPAVEDPVERAKWQRLAATPAAAIERVVREIESRYGSVAGYLRAAGVSGEQVQRLQDRLVAP